MTDYQTKQRTAWLHQERYLDRKRKQIAKLEYLAYGAVIAVCGAGLALIVCWVTK